MNNIKYIFKKLANIFLNKKNKKWYNENMPFEEPIKSHKKINNNNYTHTYSDRIIDYN